MRAERLEAGEAIGPEPGDTVEVVEDDSAPWITGRWRGVVGRITPDGTPVVKPLPAFAKRPLAHAMDLDRTEVAAILARTPEGLRLSAADDVRVIAVGPGPYEPARSSEPPYAAFQLRGGDWLHPSCFYEATLRIDSPFRGRAIERMTHAWPRRTACAHCRRST